jgi:uncharacterized delta-60 repeat protein
MDIILIKYDNIGNKLFDTTWNSPAYLDDFVVGMKVDTSGNCYIGGIATPDTFSGSADYITLKYASNGNLQWSQQYSRPGVNNGKDELASIAQDNTGDIWVTGRSSNGSNDDFLTIKYDHLTGNPIISIPYNGGNTDRATSIVCDYSGNAIVTGRSNNGNNYDFRTVKYSNSGSFQWSRLYNAPFNQDDRPVALAVDLNNNIVVTGYSDIDPFGTSNYDFQTIKYDSLGTQQWVVRTGNVYNQDDLPNDLVIDNLGNVFVTGKSDKDPLSASTDQDMMTVMYSPSGSLQWSNSPSYHEGTTPNGDDAANSLILDGSGNLYVAGYTKNNVTQKDATVVKYDVATGSEVWFKDYNGEGDFSESAKSIVADANRNSYTAGYTYVDGENLDGIIAKYDPSGFLLCSYLYNGIKFDDDEFKQIAISSNGSIYAIGYTKVSGQKSDMLLVKWNPSTCDTTWTRTYDYVHQADKAESMAIDALGNIYVTGRSDSNPVDSIDNNDFVTIKYDSNGGVLWTQRYNGSADLRDEPTKIILDNNGDVIVGGRTEISHDDIILIKYNALTGNPVWSQPTIYNGPFANDDRINDLTVDASNNIFIAGYSQTGTGSSTNDPLVLKFNSSGVQTGFNSYNGLGNDEAVRVATNINGDLYVLYKYDTEPGLVLNTYDMLLKKYDNLLSTSVWANPPQYSSPINGDVVPADLIVSPSGNVFITGTIDNDTSGGKVNKNWITLGYSSLGQQIFSSNFDGPNFTDDSPNAMVILGDDLWVCGSTEGTGSNQKDFTVLNYSLLGVGVDEVKLFATSTVYPNPFSQECTIVLKNSNPGLSALLTVYDLLGNRVSEPVSVSGNSFILQKGKLSPGIRYFQ